MEEERGEEEVVEEERGSRRRKNRKRRRRKRRRKNEITRYLCSTSRVVTSEDPYYHSERTLGEAGMVVLFIDLLYYL